MILAMPPNIESTETEVRADGELLRAGRRAADGAKVFLFLTDPLASIVRERAMHNHGR